MINKKNIADYNFGQLLSFLLSISRQKSYVLANFLNYDVSYISKWVTGTMLPAAKHINAMCTEIAEFIVDNADEMVLKELMECYGAEETEELKTQVYDSLMKAFRMSCEKKGKSKSILIAGEDNSRTVINPHLQKLYITGVPKQFSDNSEKFKLAMMVDLFALGKEDKMRIARADDEPQFIRQTNEIHYLISFAMDMIDDSFDALLLTHLFNSFADYDFRVSYYHRVPCSLIFAVQNYCMHMTLLSQNYRAIMSDTCLDSAVVNEMYDTIISLEQSFTKPMIRNSTLQNLIEEKKYLSFMISSNIWLYLTRMDEFFLPDTLFEKILNRIDGKTNNIEEIRSLHGRFQTTLRFADIKMAISESCLQDYAINGKMDFYGNSIELSVEEREEHLRYIEELLKRGDVSLKGYSISNASLKEFNREFEPCIYFSDCLSYIRLRSSKEPNKVSVVSSGELEEIYRRFFKTLFKKEEAEIGLDMSPYLNLLQMLKN